MIFENLKDEIIKQAPRQGHVLAYTQKKIIFSKYDAICDGATSLQELVGETELLEIHLFDDEKEYRAMVSTSVRFKDKQYVSTVVAFDATEAYCESMQLEMPIDGVEQITVLNHIAFDQERGMATIDNYRLKMGG